MKNAHIPTIFVVLGATGDLMTKKIVPAVFNLHSKKELPQKFEFLGVSRREWTDADFQAHVRGILEKRGATGDGTRAKSIEPFLKLVGYHRLTFSEAADYAALAKKLKEIDDRWGVCTNKLFYLSVPPQFYDEIFEHLHASGLTAPCGDDPNLPEGAGWTRVIVEKPFGNDEKTAKALDVKLAKLFKEEQIYRIDHYLAKEMLQNILAFRFANNLFENEWDANFIERINIRMFETIGVEDRGAFYDGVGALRDVGQNHLLQMLALVTMRRPADFGAAAVRDARAEILERLEIPTAQQAGARSFRAQYHGYHTIKGVASRSETESYFKLYGFLNDPCWRGVPIYMESGKRLKDDVNEIEIVLKSEEGQRGDAHAAAAHQNRIIIQVEPKEGIFVKFYSKKPGHAFELEERTFEFDFRGAGRPQTQYTEEYEKLILDCIDGDQTLFVSSREIAAMWRFTDPFTDAWQKQKGVAPLVQYAPDTDVILAEADRVLASRGSSSSSPISHLPSPVSRQFGLIGLGKMGANLARQLREKGWRVIVYNRTPEKVAEMECEGFEGARDIDELIERLDAPMSGAPMSSVRTPRVIWLMITAGTGVDDFLFGDKKTPGLASKLRRGDIVIDGGNSFFEDSIRRAKLLAKRGIKFLDVGVSGGPGGARRGASMMIGGDRAAFEKLEQLFADGSVADGYGYFGKAGAGHFVKMVHNGIEYGMMQAIAEGFALMKQVSQGGGRGSSRRAPFKLDLQKIAQLYNHGSVIESRLIGWLESGFKAFGTDLKKVSGVVAYTGEGEWTVKTAKKWKLHMPVIEDSFKFRVRSKRAPSYTGKILSALRNQFGGHKA